MEKNRLFLIDLNLFTECEMKMKGKNIVFPKAYEAVLEEQDFDISNINPNSVAIKTQYSIVSASNAWATMGRVVY